MSPHTTADGFIQNPLAVLFIILQQANCTLASRPWTIHSAPCSYCDWVESFPDLNVCIASLYSILQIFTFWHLFQFGCVFTLACLCSRMEPAQETHSFLRSYAGSHATEHIACVRSYTLYLVLRVQTSNVNDGPSARVQHQTLGIVLTKDGVLRVE